MLNLDAQQTVGPPKPKKRHGIWFKPWNMERDDKRAYTTIMVDLYNTDMASYIRMTPELFEMLKERLAPRLTKRTSNWREPLRVGL